MLKILNYSNDFRGNNTKYFVKDYELIKINNEVLNNNDSLKTFKIKLNENEKNGYNNPVIEFIILNSVYNYKSKNIENYDLLLFENVRNIFKDMF